ncbi:hypothetical protein HDK64DRAFT_326833, partial [Phyllosticta capitalensis]
CPPTTSAPLRKWLPQWPLRYTPIPRVSTRFATGLWLLHLKARATCLSTNYFSASSSPLNSTRRRSKVSKSSSINCIRSTSFSSASTSRRRKLLLRPRRALAPPTTTLMRTRPTSPATSMARLNPFCSTTSDSAGTSLPILWRTHISLPPTVTRQAMSLHTSREKPFSSSIEMPGLRAATPPSSACGRSSICWRNGTVLRTRMTHTVSLCWRCSVREGIPANSLRASPEKPVEYRPSPKHRPRDQIATSEHGGARRELTWACGLKSLG